MIELLKYLANNLGPEDLLRLAQFLSKNPQIIDEKTLLEIINEVDGYEMHRVADSQYDELAKRMKEIDEINYNSQLYKLLKDNDISLN
jgi:uncharacterized protein (UPF0305 family)|tara:strand:- start:32 stop:295 length:264 start_codon:yes stop_codon:yes gene_type:complete